MRLLTRGDFDGVVCAALLRQRGLVDDVVFVDPRQMQHREIAVSAYDITANLPYVEGVQLAFDHHLSERTRVANAPSDRFINDPSAPSAARVIYRHFGGRAAFPNVPIALMAAVDKADTAGFSQDEILNPSGYVLLNFLLDGRTGLSRFREFKVSTNDLLQHIVETCIACNEEELLRLPDVSERVRLYFEHEHYAQRQIRRIAELVDGTAVLDYRKEDPIFAGNRFLVYALYPEVSASMHVLPADDDRALIAIGRSIVNRVSNVDAGALCLAYGGGGHAAAATCQVPRAQADRVVAELLVKMQTPTVAR